METLLRALRGGPVTLEIPQRGEKHKQMRLALANAEMQLTEFVARRERRNRQNFAVTALQEDLGLPAVPNRIEGFDISHLGGTDTVASQVVFVDGRPEKKEYRHYNVKTVDGIDDFASMREIVSRRIRHLREEGKPLPDLLLIDGGKGQLHAAYEALKEHGCEDQAILGLAKRLEEIFVPGQSEPLVLPRTSAALRLLQQIRDEAHRFAITFQRGKRKSRLTESWLDAVPGVGEKTKTKLLKALKSPDKIREASPEALAAVVGKATAGKIIGYLANPAD
jgi:excinuclease ABC subunit C